MYFFSKPFFESHDLYRSTLLELQQEKEVGIIFLDGDIENETAKMFNVNDFPSIVFVENGKLLYKHSGFIPKTQLVNILDFFFKIL